MRTRFDHQSGSRRFRLVALLGLIGLAVSLLAPIGDFAARAEIVGDPPEEATDDIPAVDPTEAPPDDSQDAAPPTETPSDAVAAPNRLTISVFRCDHPEYDTGLSSNIQLVLTQCTQPGYGTFTVERAIGPATQSGQSLEFQVEFVGVIEESVPPGYDHPIANCFVYDVDGNLIDQIGPGEAGGGFWKVSASGTNVHCDWYQVDRGLGTVYIVNMACPAVAGLQPAPSMSELVAMCSLPAGQKAFLVDHGAGLTRQGVTGGEFNDTLIEALHTGSIAIRMDSPGGFDRARVFCQVNTLEGVEIAPFAEFPVSSFKATGITLGHLQRLHCSWFNIAAGPGFSQGDDPAPSPTPRPLTGLPDIVADRPEVAELPEIAVDESPPPANPSELTIVKHTCPEDYEPDDDDSEPLEDCPTGLNGASFTLTSLGTSPGTVTTSSTATSYTFGNLPAGNHVVHEVVPPGTEDIFVLGCGGGGGIDPIPQFIDGTLAISIPPGVLLTCHWFNIPEDDDDLAPDDAGPDQSSAAQAPTPTPTPVPGAVADPPQDAVNEVPPARNPITILPEIVGERAEEAEVIDEPVSAPRLARIDISFSTCETGYEPTATGASPISDCSPGIESLAFEIAPVDPSVSLEGTTVDELGDASGTLGLGYGSLPPGDYVLTQDVPAGVATVFTVGCDGTNGGDPVIGNGTHTVTLAAGVHVSCYWFNVGGAGSASSDAEGEAPTERDSPAPAPGTGALTVINHTCATAAFESATACPVDLDGQGFDLVWWNGNDWEHAAAGTTDASGSYTFASLEPGEYWLDEQGGHWCHLESDDLAPEGHWLNVYDGQETVVRIYTCG